MTYPKQSSSGIRARCRQTCVWWVLSECLLVPLSYCPRHGTEKRQASQPRAAPALAISGGDRREADAGGGSGCAVPFAGYRPAGRYAVCCWRRPRRFSSRLTSPMPLRRRCCGTPRSTLRIARTDSLPTACPGFPPRAHRQRQADG